MVINRQSFLHAIELMTEEVKIDPHKCCNMLFRNLYGQINENYVDIILLCKEIIIPSPTLDAYEKKVIIHEFKQIPGKPKEPELVLIEDLASLIRDGIEGNFR